MKEARRMMKNGQFEEAAVIFENIYWIQEKVFLFKSACETKLDDDEAQEDDILETLCLLISTLNATDNQIDAQKYAEDAVKLISSSTSSPPSASSQSTSPTSSSSSSSPSMGPSSWMPATAAAARAKKSNKFEAKSDLIVPLLVLAIRLSKSTGKTDSIPLMEEMLAQYRAKRINVEMQPTLLDIMMARVKWFEFTNRRLNFRIANAPHLTFIATAARVPFLSIHFYSFGPLLHLYHFSLSISLNLISLLIDYRAYLALLRIEIFSIYPHFLVGNFSLKWKAPSSCQNFWCSHTTDCHGNKYLTIVSCAATASVNHRFTMPFHIFSEICTNGYYL